MTSFITAFTIWLMMSLENLMRRGWDADDVKLSDMLCGCIVA
jgi:hypothetical protein